MRVREVSKGEFGAIFGKEEVRNGNFVYYLTMDRLEMRKDLRTNTVEVVGTGYEEIHEEQLEKDILNSICGEFKGYELDPVNRPFWERRPLGRFILLVTKVYTMSFVLWGKALSC